MINPPSNTPQTPLPKTSPSNLLNLKVGKQLDALVHQLSSDKKTLILSINHKNITAAIRAFTQTEQALTKQLKTGQTLKLVVTKLQPTTEFKVITADTKNTPITEQLYLQVQKSKPSLSTKLTTPIDSNITLTKNSKPIAYTLKTLSKQFIKNQNNLKPSIIISPQNQTSKSEAITHNIKSIATVKQILIQTSKTATKPQLNSKNQPPKAAPEPLTVKSSPEATTQTLKSIATVEQAKQTSKNIIKNKNLQPLDQTIKTMAKPQLNLKNQPPKAAPEPLTVKSSPEATTQTLKSIATVKQAKQTSKNIIKNKNLQPLNQTIKTMAKPQLNLKNQPPKAVTEPLMVKPSIPITHQQQITIQKPVTQTVKPFLTIDKINVQPNQPSINTTKNKKQPNIHVELALNQNQSVKLKPDTQLVNRPTITHTITPEKSSEVLAQAFKPPSTQALVNLPIFHSIQAVATSKKQSIQAIKQVLIPKQISTTEFIQQLSQSSTQINNNSYISDEIKQLVQKILGSVPRTKELTHLKSLKKIITQSGIFLETSTLNTQIIPNNVPFNNDFKGLLLKLIFKLSTHSPVNEEIVDYQHSLVLLKDLKIKAEGTLARITLNQLYSTSQEDPQKQQWLLELPYIEKKQLRTLAINFEQQHTTHTTEENHSTEWSVNLTLTPPNLGTLHCKIGFSNNKVHVNFLSTLKQSNAALNLHLDYLSAQLEAVGLQPGKINANHQQAVKTQTLLDSTSLFDDNA